MCGGGGGGDGGAAQRKAEEEQRVAQAIASLNNVFGVNDPKKMATREALYGTMKEDAVNKAMMDLNKDKERSARELNFMLARQGLSGGSADIDQNRELADTYQQGILQAANIGDSVANNARSSDDRTRVNLINSVRSGLDGGTASQLAYEGMRNNINEAKNEAQNASLAGFFNNLMNGWNQYQYGQGQNDVLMKNQKQSNPVGGGGTQNYDGNVRSI